MHKAFEHRLYPNRVQHRQLLSCLAENRRIYNEMLLQNAWPHTLEVYNKSIDKVVALMYLAGFFDGEGCEYILIAVKGRSAPYHTTSKSASLTQP
jgi:hypothetical protein